MSDLRLACATDAAYAPYCAAMLQGLLQQHHEGVVVHLLHDLGLDPAILARLRALVERGSGRWEPVGVAAAAVDGLPRMPRIPPLMWLRVLLPELLPRANRILYVDVDTLALRRLDELWRTDLDSNLVGAVDNVLHSAMSLRPAALGMPSGTRYFNSGVLLMDLEGMRREGTARQLLRCARERGAELLWPDQDVLNIVLAGRRKALHPRWNCQNSLFYARERSIGVFGAASLDEAVRAPGLLHFEGPSWAKPWHFLNDHPYRSGWRAAQVASSWPLPRPRHPLKRLLGSLPSPVIGALRSLLRYPRPAVD